MSIVSQVDCDFPPIVRLAFDACHMCHGSLLTTCSWIFYVWMAFALLFPEIRPSYSEGCSVYRHEGCILELKQTVYPCIQPGLLIDPLVAPIKGQGVASSSKSKSSFQEKEYCKSNPSTGIKRFTWSSMISPCFSFSLSFRTK